jgi:hypothetical protein
MDSPSCGILTSINLMEIFQDARLSSAARYD